jgi:hypothetical protein
MPDIRTGAYGRTKLSPDGTDAMRVSNPLGPQDPMEALATLLGVSAKPSAAAVDAAGPQVRGTPNEPDPSEGTSTSYDFGRGTQPGSFAGMSLGTTETPYEEKMTAYSKAIDAAEEARRIRTSALSDFFLPQAEQQRAEDIAGKVQVAQAPAAMTGEYNLASERMKAQALRDVASIKAGGSAMAPEDISYWADQVQRTPAMLTRVPAANKGDVMHELANRGADLDDITNQAKARAEASATMLEPNPSTGLSTFDELRQMGAQLEQKGWFNPMTSPLRKWAAGHGIGLVAGDTDTAKLFGQFESRLGLAISQLQNIHAGARGAASRDLRAAFEAMINAKGDPSTFNGQLNSAEELIRGYAAENAPVRGGVRQPYGNPAADPYSNPNYQPK